MSGISHFSRKSRGGEEWRYVPLDSRSIRNAYREMRGAGISTFRARMLVIRILQCGRYGSVTRHEAKP